MNVIPPPPGHSVKPALLFLSPVMPATGGSGIAMRAGATIEALAADYDVHLLVIPVTGAPTPVPEFLRRLCSRVLLHPAGQHADPAFRQIEAIADPAARLAARLAYPGPALARYATTASVQAAAELAAGPDYRAVHVLRLYLAPFAAPYLALRQRPPHIALDTDDDEVTARRRTARRLRQDGDEPAALIEEAEARHYEALAAVWLPHFHQLYAACQTQRARLAAAYPQVAVAVLPDVIRPPGPVGWPAARAPFTFVFVGNFGHYPNADGARYLCSEILPLLRSSSPGAFQIRFVGANPPPALRAQQNAGDVVVVGPVRRITPTYESAHAAVVPVRAGGGTRVKILEAFAHQRPVVSTSVGADGLGVTPGLQLLAADSPEDFAAACTRLMKEPALGPELATHGAAFARRHEPGLLREILSAAGPVSGGAGPGPAG
jgi:glycosyltransferase involved in cell wall biosynthesis